MKRITFLILAVTLVFSACSATNNAPSNSNTEAPKSTEAQTSESMSRLEAIEKRLAAVEAALAKIAGTTLSAPQAQPESNRKLSQDNAEKAIKGFASTNPSANPIATMGTGRGTVVGCFFNVQSIAKIEQLSQFSDTEATSVVTSKCGEVGTIRFEFVFKKDIDNRWFLVKIQFVQGEIGSQGEADWINRRNQNLKVFAQ